MALRWRCLEVGCNAVVSADSEAELVEATNDHIRDAHDSYELEEVILAGAVETTTKGSRR